MSVIDVLMGEHQLFRRLIIQLQKALQLQENAARREARDVLLVLLPALERHEELEDLVFGPEGEEDHSPKIVSELNKEHWRIALLRADIAEVMKDSDQLLGDQYRIKILELVVKLREHFEMEELRLWPRYRELAHKRLGRALERRALAQLKRLHREVERRGGMLSDHAR